jgi:hypothetical protein
MNPTSMRTARLLCTLAVLLGLFGMHGLATAQAGGCHGGDGMIGAVSAVPAAMTAVVTDEPMGSMATEPAATSRTADVMTGSSCVFVPPTGWPALALVLIALVAAMVVLPVDRLWAPGGAGRSPPRSGVSLLRGVCLSRT